MRPFTHILTSVASLMFVAPAAATNIPAPAVQCTMEMGAVSDTWMPSGTGDPDSDQFDYNGVRTGPGSMWDVTWDATVKKDPWVDSLIVVTNNTASLQTFTFTFTLPVSPALASPTRHAGSMQGGITDNSPDSINGTVDTDPVSGAPFFAGMIDGATGGGLLTLHDHPTSVSAPFYGGSANIPSVSGGLPGITRPSGAVTTSIGIKHVFRLTAGDTTTLSGYFIVIPEPATALLLGLGGLLLLRRSRQ